MAAVIGKTSVDLTAKKGVESNLGDLATDAMREATKAQIAFYNSGGIRAAIQKGEITFDKLYAAFPFENVLVTMRLSGEQVRRVLEQGVAGEFGGLQMSGISVRYDLKQAVGERVVEAYVGSEPLSPERVYSVVTNDFLAAGGDRMTAFAEGKNVAWGDTLMDALTAYLKKHSPVSPRVAERIRFTE